MRVELTRTSHALHAPAIAACVLAAWSMVGSPARADETCVGCHEQRAEARLRAPVMASRHDVHAEHDVTCSGCHGGNPEERSARAHDLGRGFVGHPSPVGTVGFCGRCHDGSTDAPAVLDGFRDSRHSHALGEERFAATCTSCHGAHGIVPASELRGAPSQRARQITICARCHSDRERMSESGLPTDQARQWARSAHGRAVASGNLTAPVCTTCHEPHRAAAGLDAVSACGRCHEGIRAAFDRGPHAGRFSSMGFLDCVECHGSHEAQPPSAAMLTGIDAVCTRCHGSGQPMFPTIARIAALAPRLDRARAELAREDPRRAEILGALHALDPEALEESLEGFEPLETPAPAEATSSPFAGDQRWVGLLEVLGAVLLGMGVLWIVQRFRRRS
jgi:predicted CXXCH cytochrome family protein